VNNLSFCWSRIKGLERFRLELANPVNLKESVRELMKQRLKRCFLLKAVDIRFV